MPEVKRKPKESFESFYRRFTGDVKLSGRVLQARKIRFFQKGKNKRAQKESALRRKKIQDKLDYLTRTGKVKDQFPGAKAIFKLN